MTRSSTAPEPGEAGFAEWFAFWAQFAILALLAFGGALYASEDAQPGDYACGLILTVTAIALAFLRLKYRFDGGGADWGRFLLVDDMANLILVVVVFAILALAGLFVAAGVDRGGLHDAGIALFVASGLMVFLSLRHVFDNIDRPG